MRFSGSVPDQADRQGQHRYDQGTNTMASDDGNHVNSFTENLGWILLSPEALMIPF
jgi:hypothetical protein